jgi:hypothetical protein
MTGLYPHQAVVGDMNEEGSNNEFWKRVGSSAYLGFKSQGVVTLSEPLREAGYQRLRGFERQFALIGGACEQFTEFRSWQNKRPITRFGSADCAIGTLMATQWGTDPTYDTSAYSCFC